MPQGIDFVGVAPGSFGDVHPVAAIGIELRRRGHGFHLLAGPNAAELAQRAGLPYEPLCTPEEHARFIRDPDLRRRGRRYVAALMQPCWKALRNRAQPGRTALLALPFALPARVVNEARGIPLASIQHSPVLLRSAYDAPGWPLSRIVPGRGLAARLLRRAQFLASDVWMAGPAIRPSLDRLCREAGLQPPRRPFHAWLHSPELNIGLFPEWFAPPQPDWPPNVQFAGFPLFDGREVGGAADDLEEFLAAGPPPVAVTPGSGMVLAAEFLRCAWEACRQLGLRVVLLTPDAEQVPRALTPDAIRVAYAPFSAVFPRCRAVIHHGGIGTTAQALAAGAPQIVVPWGHDQHANAERIEQLGAGRRLSRLAWVLRELSESPHVAEQCRRYAERTRDTHAITAACDRIEIWARQRLASHDPSPRNSDWR